MLSTVPVTAAINRAGYITGTNLIELCHANVHRADQDLERVLRHEMVHAIQENFDLR